MLCNLVRAQIGVSDRQTSCSVRCHESYQKLSEAEVAQGLHRMLRCLDRGDFDPDPGRLDVIVVLDA